MADAEKPGGVALFYLDDLHVWQRFTSGSHVLDEAQIKGFEPALSESANN